MGFFMALNQVYEPNLGAMNLELDSKVVVGHFLNNKYDGVEFGDTIGDYRYLFFILYRNYNVKFVRKQSNK